MFKAIRISILLFILFFVGVSTWLTQARSTDWGNSLWVKVYPINADGSDASSEYIAGLETDDFSDIEEFIARETERYGKTLSRPLRMELGRPIREQPPEIEPGSGVLGVMLWWRRTASFLRHAATANVLIMTAGFVLLGYQLAGFFFTGRT